MAANLIGLRVGQHDRFVRVVLDFDRKTDYSTGFDRLGRVFLRLPGTIANPVARRLKADYEPLKQIEVKASSDGKGSIVLLEINGQISTRAFDLEPDDISGHRIVIDLMPVSAPQ